MKSIIFCSIVLNEEEYIEASLRQHIDFCDKWIIVEGCCNGYPRRNTTELGLSGDNTAEIIRGFDDPTGKIEHVQHGLTTAFGEDAKAELRNEYAKRITEEAIVLVLDIDEFYRHEHLGLMIERMQYSGVSCWRVPQVHFWPDRRHFITGGYFDIPHNRLYNWQPGLLYRSNHNHPQFGTGDYLHETQEYVRESLRIGVKSKGYGTDQVHCYHYGFMKAEENVRDKNDFYVLRGEQKSRPGTTECRKALLEDRIPEGCNLRTWVGQLPEVFQDEDK